MIEFSRLSDSEKNQFLGSINRFMLASPKVRRQILNDWGRSGATARARVEGDGRSTAAS